MHQTIGGAMRKQINKGAKERKKKKEEKSLTKVLF